MNRRLYNAGLSGRKMPDVVALARFGASKMVEVVSKSETAFEMEKKLQRLQELNPGSKASVIEWAVKLHRFLYSIFELFQ